MDKINASDKTWLKTRKKKIKYENKRNFYIKFYLKHYLEIEFTAC